MVEHDVSDQVENRATHHCPDHRPRRVVDEVVLDVTELAVGADDPHRPGGVGDEVAVAPVIGENDVLGTIERADDRDRANLLPDTCVGRAEELAFGEQRQQSLFDGADQLDLREAPRHGARFDRRRGAHVGRAH